MIDGVVGFERRKAGIANLSSIPTDGWMDGRKRRAIDDSEVKQIVLFD